MKALNTKPAAGQNGTGFAWTKGRAEAAVLLAEDELSDQEIAERVGVGRTTLATWKTHPEFRARIAEHVEELDRAARRLSIAKRRKRLQALDDQLTRLDAVIAARAADETMKGAGHETGLLVRTYKPGKFKTVEEYAVDTALLKERRETMKQAAQELGVWVEKTEHTGKDGGPIQTETRVKIDPADLTEEELDAMIRVSLRLRDGASGAAGGDGGDGSASA